jgi:hypothetical protein
MDTRDILLVGGDDEDDRSIANCGDNGNATAYQYNQTDQATTLSASKPYRMQLYSASALTALSLVDDAKG